MSPYPIARPIADPQRERFEALLARWLDGEAGAREQAELHALVVAVPAWRDELLELYAAHRQLAALHADGAAFTVGVTATIGPARRPAFGVQRVTRRLPAARSARPLRLVALGAGLAAAALMIWLAAAAPEIGRIERADGARLVRAGRTSALADGAALCVGDRVIAAAGMATRVRLDDGTALRLEGGALDLAHGSDGRRLALSGGTLAAEVVRQPAQRPLVVRTARAQMTVLGTAFSLDDAADATRLRMDHGRVRLARRTDGAAIEVADGEEATVAPGRPLVAQPRALADGLVGGWDFEAGALPGFRGRPLPVGGPRGQGVRVDQATFAEVPLAKDALARGPFALAVWARVSPAQTGEGDIVTLADYFSLRCDRSGVFILSFQDLAMPAPKPALAQPGSGSTNFEVRMRQPVDPAAWHHVLGQHTGSGYELYVDGVLVASHPTYGQVRHSQWDKLVIGHHGALDGRIKFIGDLDEVRVWRRSLTASEIRALAALGVPESR